MLSIDTEEAPRPPDHPEVAVRRYVQHRDTVVSACRKMLRRNDVECSDMSPARIVEVAAPYFGSDRKLMLDLFEQIEGRIRELVGDGERE